MNFFNKKSSGRTQDDAAQGQERDYRFNDVSGMSDADTFNFGKDAADSLSPKMGEQRLPVHPASRPTSPPLRLHNALHEDETPEIDDDIDDDADFDDEDNNAFAEQTPAKPAPLRLGGESARKVEPTRQTGAADRLASLREQLIRDAAEDNDDDTDFEDDEPEEVTAHTAPQATPVKPFNLRKPEPREIPYTAPKDGEAPQGPSIRKRGSTRILTPSQTASVLGTQPEPAARPAPEVPRTPSIRRAVAPVEPVAVEPAPAPQPPQPPVEQPAPVAAAPEPHIAMPEPTAGRATRRAGRVKTRLLGFDANAASAAPNPFENETVDGGAPDMMFPVGWLVVLKGPGRGASFTLGNGVSQIGRGEDQAVALDFGDTSISRTNHAAIAYDGEQRKHFLGQSGKANLVRLNDRPVLSTEELSNGDRIRIGETTLQFIALCGEDFDWGGDDEDDI